MPTKKKSASRARRPRPRAIVEAEHGEAPIKLTSAERTLLNEALRLGEDVRVDVEAAVASYGRWLLGAIFRDDAAAALDDHTKNPVFRELVRRAGGPTLRISRHLVYLAVRLAARDKRIVDQSWQGLDAGRKELLLPLGTDDRLREGAQHVSKFNLTHASTKHYVAEMMRASGRAPVVRLTVPRLVQRVQRLRETLGGAATLRKVHDLRDSTEPAERATAADEIDRLRGVLGEISKALRKR